MRNKLFLTVVMATTLCLQQVQADEIRIGGGAAPIENIFKKIKGPFEQKTGIVLVLTADGPDKALLDVGAGKLDVAAAGLTMKDWLALMAQRGHEIAEPAQYRNRVIGRDMIQVLAHKGVSQVKSLSKEQLRDMFTGKTSNWNQVGGPDVPVVVIYGTKIPGTNKLWQERILDGAEWVKSKVDVGDASDVKKKIASTLGAISIGPLASEDGTTIHSPESPEVGRPIIAATKGPPTGNVQLLFDFIQKDGQQYIAR